MALWSRVLAAVPESRLLVKSVALSDPEVAADAAARFAKQGIAADRLVLRGAVDSYEEHLAAYNEIDIGLDPFPYNGTTTTAEAMWMGVPVLTLKGDRFIAHVGESMLTSVGLPDWVAADQDDFVRKAATFAGNTGALAALRGRLRQQLVNSPLCDAAGFARDLEDAFYGMWRARQM